MKNWEEIIDKSTKKNKDYLLYNIFIYWINFWILDFLNYVWTTKKNKDLLDWLFAFLWNYVLFVFHLTFMKEKHLVQKFVPGWIRESISSPHLVASSPQFYLLVLRQNLFLSLTIPCPTFSSDNLSIDDIFTHLSLGLNVKTILYIAEFFFLARRHIRCLPNTQEKIILEWTREHITIRVWSHSFTLLFSLCTHLNHCDKINRSFLVSWFFIFHSSLLPLYFSCSYSYILIYIFNFFIIITS